MKKCLFLVTALFLSISLPMNQSFAQEATLATAIDVLQYRLTVEWDQRDLGAREKIVSAFAADLELLQRQGVTDAEIFKSLSARAFDGQTAKDIETLAKYAKAKKYDAKETRALIVNYANKSQKLGTSWSSEATVAVAVGVVLIIVLVAILNGSSSNSGGDDVPVVCYDRVCPAPPEGMDLTNYCLPICY